MFLGHATICRVLTRFTGERTSPLRFVIGVRASKVARDLTLNLLFTETWNRRIPCVAGKRNAVCVVHLPAGDAPVPRCHTA